MDYSTVTFIVGFVSVHLVLIYCEGLNLQCLIDYSVRRSPYDHVSWTNLDHKLNLILSEDFPLCRTNHQHLAAPILGWKPTQVDYYLRFWLWIEIHYLTFSRQYWFHQVHLRTLSFEFEVYCHCVVYLSKSRNYWSQALLGPVSVTDSCWKWNWCLNHSSWAGVERLYLSSLWMDHQLIGLYSNLNCTTKISASFHHLNSVLGLFPASNPLNTLWSSPSSGCLASDWH